MKIILAFIPPFRLDRVTLALHGIDGVNGMTVTDARGFGHGKRSRDGTTDEALVDYTPTTRVECVVSDQITESVIQAILDAAHTGSSGDGRIFVAPIEQAVRIKTRERGPHTV